MFFRFTCQSYNVHLFVWIFHPLHKNETSTIQQVELNWKRNLLEGITGESLDRFTSRSEGKHEVKCLPGHGSQTQTWQNQIAAAYMPFLPSLEVSKQLQYLQHAQWSKDGNVQTTGYNWVIFNSIAVIESFEGKESKCKMMCRTSAQNWRFWTPIEKETKMQLWNAVVTTGKTEFKQHQRIITNHHHSEYHFLQTKPLKI